MAKLYTGGYEIVVFDRSWHGMTAGASVGDLLGRAAGYGPPTPGNLALPTPNAYRSPFRALDGPHDWEAELDYGFALVDQQSSGSLARSSPSRSCRPAASSSCRSAISAALKEKCDERGMLLILDEAQTGLGRTGDHVRLRA